MPMYNTDDPVIQTFDYLQTHPKRALLPFHLRVGDGKTVDRDLYEFLVLVGVSGEADVLATLDEFYREKRNIHALLRLMLTIFGYYARSNENDRVLKKLKKHINGFARAHGMPCLILNVAKLANRAMQLQYADKSFEDWVEYYTPESYKREYKIEGHSRYYVVNASDQLIDPHSPLHYPRPGEKARTNHWKRIGAGLALALALVAVVGDTISGILQGGGFGIISVATGLFAVAVGLPIANFSARQNMKLLFSGDLFKNDDGSPMSTTQKVKVAGIFALCLVTALTIGLMAIAIICSPYTLIPISVCIGAGLLGGTISAFSLLSYFTFCADFYRAGLTTSIKTFFRHTFDPRLSLTHRIMRGVALVLAAAAVVAIIAVSFPYTGGLILPAVVGLGLSSTAATCVIGTLLTLAAPVLMYQYSRFCSRVFLGIMDGIHTGCSAIHKAIKHSFTPPPPPPEPDEHPARTANISFFMRLQKAKSVMSNVLLQVCQVGASFYNQALPASVHPNCLAVTKTIGLSETISPIAIAGLSTAENLTSTAQGIEELATHPTCESAPGDVDLGFFLQSTSRFFRNRVRAPQPPPPEDHHFAAPHTPAR